MVANWKQNLLTDWVSYKSFNGHAVLENCLLAAIKKQTHTHIPKTPNYTRKNTVIHRGVNHIFLY